MAPQPTLTRPASKENSTLQGSPWERYGARFANGLPYATLVISLCLAFLQPELGWRDRGWLTLLSVLAAGWVYLLYTRSAPNQWCHPLRMLFYFAGFLAFAVALMSWNAIFFLFAITGFIHAGVLRPWPFIFLGVGLTSIVINTVITGFPWPDSDTWIFYGALIGFQTLSAGLSILFVERVSGLSEERRQAVERLEIALKENAGLQAQLVTQAREAGILEERQRLAREIHDTLAQGLTGIITQLSAFEQARDPQRRQWHFDNALHLARESLTEARRSVHALRPGQLASSTLPGALEEVVQDWSQVHAIPASLTITGDPVDLSPAVEAALLRTAQEALANASKHAQATRLGLTLSFIGDEVALDIRDNGVGFQPAGHAAHDRGGFGLDSMQQRLAQVRGTLEIESEPGNGTAVSARVPLVAVAQEAENR